MKSNVNVIGAGLSGLAPARQLMSFGYKVTVLEGRKPPGERVYTKKKEGAKRLYADMKVLNITPNIVTYNSLIDGYGNVGQLAKSMCVYDDMKEIDCYLDVSTKLFNHLSPTGLLINSFTSVFVSKSDLLVADFVNLSTKRSNQRLLGTPAGVLKSANKRNWSSSSIK